MSYFVTVTGTIRQSVTGSPVFAARVRHPAARRATTTDEKGNFSFSVPRLRGAASSIVVLAPGFWPRQVPFSLVPGQQLVPIGNCDLSPFGEFFEKRWIGKLLAYLIMFGYGLTRFEKLQFAAILFLAGIVVLPVALAFLVDAGVDIPWTDLDENAREVLQRLGWFPSAHPPVQFKKVHSRYFAHVNYALPVGVYEVPFSEVAVEQDSTLTVAPGTVLKFAPNSHLTVFGRLIAKGSEGARIVFTARDKTWGNITFWNTEPAGSALHYCDISYGSGQRCRGGQGGAFVRDENGNQCGGGVLVYDTCVDFSNVKFERCSAAFGGGVYLRNAPQGATPEAPGSRFTDVRFEDCTAQGVKVSGGGAVFTQRCYPEFRKCKFVGNHATGQFACGGAVYFGRDSQGLLEECVLDRNGADAEGGAVYAISPRDLAQSGEAGVVLRDVEVTANNARGTGGGLSGSNARVKIDGCTFRGNTVAPAAFLGNVSSANGGAVSLVFQPSYASGTPICIVSTRFLENRVDAPGKGATEGFAGGALNLSADLTVQLELRDLLFAGNSAPLGDHVVTSSPARFEGWSGAWDALTQFQLPSRDDHSVVIRSEAPASTAPAPPTQTAITDFLLPPECSNERPQTATINAVVIHYTSAMNVAPETPYDLQAIVRIFTGDTVPSGPRTSAHYLIDREGRVFRLVDERQRAWHAGFSRMPDGDENVNDFSVGIEMMCKPDDLFTSQQYASLITVVTNLRKRYHIEYERIVGHDMVRALYNKHHSEAPKPSKEDPGPAFQWAYFVARLTQRE